MSVVISTKFNMKLYITKYNWVPNFGFLSSIYSEICLIIDIQDGHFKVQDGGQVSCQNQFHMDSYKVKCMCANFGSPVANNILKYSSFGIDGDHFLIQDGGQILCR